MFWKELIQNALTQEWTTILPKYVHYPCLFSSDFDIESPSVNSYVFEWTFAPLASKWSFDAITDFIEEQADQKKQIVYGSLLIKNSCTRYWSVSSERTCSIHQNMSNSETEEGYFWVTH